MDAAKQIIEEIEAMPLVSTVILGGISLLLFFFVRNFIFNRRGRSNEHRLPPEVPGLPLLGNLLQLTEKKPHKTFAKWAEIYGPIYRIRTGSATVVVLNSADVAKEVHSFEPNWLTLHHKPYGDLVLRGTEAMVTRYSSICTRKLSNALTILTSDKSMVATSDYNDFHRLVKKYLLTNVLGAAAQKRHRGHRDAMLENIVSRLHAHVKSSPLQPLNFREIFESELFGMPLRQGLGRDLDSIYVEELGTTLSKEEMMQVLVHDPMEGAIEVDWRDFFPYLRWVPNKGPEIKIQRMFSRRKAVMKALIEQQKKRFAMGEDENCYLNFLLTEANTLTEEQKTMLIWEIIIETSDTVMVATEWAMYELAKDQTRQDRLYREIEKVCGSNKITEDNLSELPYLNSVFHETLRKYSPAPVVPIRYAHEDTQLGGYHIPAGSQIAINIYGCNMDKKRWENPEEWQPERFLDKKYDMLDLHKTMAFGAGKRACAGALEANLIACTHIGRLVQEFEWGLKDGEEENVDTLGLTTRKLLPLHVVAKPRRAQ